MVIHSNAPAILQDLCGDDPLYLELVAKLLDTERRYSAVQKASSIPANGTPNPTSFLGAHHESPHRHLQSPRNLL